MQEHADKSAAEEAGKRNKLKEHKPYVYQKIVAYDEKVKKGESIAILQFQYDYTCNFACEHCSVKRFQGRKEGRRFTIEDVRELSRQADAMGLGQIVITGGEPLIFPDFDEIVRAIDPNKFWIVSDTNGWLLDEQRAKHLKEIGVDKIQLSLDSFVAQEHDSFRRTKDSYRRALRAIDAAQNAGLDIIIATVVTKQRIRTQEFLDLLEFGRQKGIGIFVTYAKPVGAWEGNFDALVTRDDMDYMRELERTYPVFTHLTPAYGLDQGCIAVKRMVSITQYGDVMPCPYIHVSLGNFFDEPLKDIIERGLSIKHFGTYKDTCLIAEDRAFIHEYIEKRVYGKPLPVDWKDVFENTDLIRPEERKLYREK